MWATGVKLAARLTPLLPAGKQPWLPSSVLPGCGTDPGLHQYKSDASHLTSAPEPVHPTIQLEKETAMVVLAVLINCGLFSPPGRILQMAVFHPNPRNFASHEMPRVKEVTAESTSHITALNSCLMLPTQCHEKCFLKLWKETAIMYSHGQTACFSVAWEH